MAVPGVVRATACSLLRTPVYVASVDRFCVHHAPVAGVPGQSARQKRCDD